MAFEPTRWRQTTDGTEVEVEGTIMNTEGLDQTRTSRARTRRGRQGAKTVETGVGRHEPQLIDGIVLAANQRRNEPSYSSRHTIGVPGRVRPLPPVWPALPHRATPR